MIFLEELIILLHVLCSNDSSWELRSKYLFTTQLRNISGKLAYPAPRDAR